MQDPTRGTGKRWLAAVGVSTLLIGACGSGGGGDDASGSAEPPSENRGREVVDEGTAAYGGNLVVGISGETDGWTPQTNTFADAGSFVIPTIVESLAVIDDSGEPVPHLAESWEHDEEFKEWTVTLRDGISFHDGTPFDAEAAVENFQRAIDSPLVGTALSPMIDSVEEVDGDPLTFTISLNAPWSSLPNSFAQQPGMMVSPRMFEMDFFGADQPIGTGPFVFKEWVVDDHLTVVRNDDYWRTTESGDELPYLDSIEFRVITDGAARASTLKTGDLDLMYTTRAADIAAFREDDSVQLIEDNQSEETFIQFNEAVPPFDNINARRAVVLATDPLAVAAVLGENIAEPIDQPWAEDHPAYLEETGYPEFDLDAAREAVEAYKADTGEERLAFTVKGLNSVDDFQLLQLLQQQWAEADIEVEVESVEQTTFIVDLAASNFQAAFFRNFSYRQLDSLYVFLHSRFAQYDPTTEAMNISINFTQTKVDEIDELLDETRETDPSNTEVWNGNYQEITRILNEHLPYVWLFRTPYALVARPDVHGLNTPRETGFGNFEPKWWMNEVWLED